MITVNFYELTEIKDELLKFAVVMAKTEGKWVFCKHRERDTYEFPGGHRDPSSVVVLGKFRRFHFPILSICSPEPRFFPYLLQIFNALSELFLLKKIFRYVIIIVLYRTFSEGGYGLLFKKRKEEKRDIFTNV